MFPSVSWGAMMNTDITCTSLITVSLMSMVMNTYCRVLLGSPCDIDCRAVQINLTEFNSYVYATSESMYIFVVLSFTSSQASHQYNTVQPICTATLRSKADLCDFVVKCTACEHDAVSYASSMVEDQMIVGCADRGIQSEVFAKGCQLQAFQD